MNRSRTVDGFRVLLPVHAFLFLALFAGLFHSAYRYMFSIWTVDDYNYCYFIPVAVAYLLWEKRAAFRSAPSENSWAGLVPFCGGIVLYLLGELGGEYYSLFIASWLIAVGYCWAIMGGPRLKTIAFPVLFIIAMFPFPNFINNNLTLRLKLLSSHLGVKMLQFCGLSAYREGNVIDLGFTRLQVVDACSGLRFLLPLIVLGILLAHFYRASWWKRGVIVLMAIPLSILTNAMRVAGVGFLYPYFGPQVAEGFFHDLSGWIVFMASLGCMVGTLFLLKRYFPESTVDSAAVPTGAAPRVQDPAPAQGARSISPQVVVVLLLLAATVGLSRFVNFSEKAPVARPFSEFPSRLGEWEGVRGVMEQHYLDVLTFSDYAMINYRGGHGRQVDFYAAYYASQSKGKSIHTPDSCLPSGGWVFEDSGVVTYPAGSGREGAMRAKRAVMTKNGMRALAYYWFPQRGRILTDLYQLKLYVFWDALTRRRTDGAIVRLITPIYGDESSEAADARLQAFTRELVPVLSNFLPE
ncbi:MAG: VPLPA-CTERM-specific exosortase XrtD [Candidatus Deferrimicrobium sp.]